MVLLYCIYSQLNVKLGGKLHGYSIYINIKSYKSPCFYRPSHISCTTPACCSTFFDLATMAPTLVEILKKINALVHIRCSMFWTISLKNLGQPSTLSKLPAHQNLGASIHPVHLFYSPCFEISFGYLECLYVP